MRCVKHTFLFILVWAVSLNGCTSWRVVEQPPGAEDPSTVRVTLKDGSRVEVRNAYAVADTLFGSGNWHFPESVVIPLQEIEEIESGHSETGKTLLLVLGIIAVGLGISLAAADWGDCCGP